MAVRSGRSRTRRAKSRTGGSSTARYTEQISTRLDAMEAAVERIRTRRPKLRRQTAAVRRASVGIKVSDIRDSVMKADMNSVLEKAADITGRWQQTAGMLGVIGGNVKSIASPVVGAVKAMNPIGRLVGRLSGGGGGAGAGLEGLAGAGSAASTAAGALSPGTLASLVGSIRSGPAAGAAARGGMDLSGIVSSVLGQLSGSGAGSGPGPVASD